MRGDHHDPRAREALNAGRVGGRGAQRQPRNTTAGTLKLQDPKLVAKRGLDTTWYGVQADTLPRCAASSSWWNSQAPGASGPAGIQALH